ncbi:MAG TPA: hypothetical protein VEF89_27020 [Solirubrobacteraceae bacterium]|nr:hypothetical protein [Solirubrobacteraceae bacterium]
MVALAELHVLHAGREGIGACELEHLVGHVQADRLPGRPDPAGGDEHVRAGAGAEIQNGFPLGSWATAVGTPHPSDAFTASSESSSPRASSYKADPNTPVDGLADVG